MFALDLLNQFQSYNGTLLAAGKIYVYHLGRTHLAPVYGDHNGATVLPNPVILDDQGMAEIYLNDAFNYTVVVCDAYGAEQFSRDVYPKGMGNGESIGTQLYEGIDPIVVNNDVYAISANTSRLGVVTPLYFVKDDEEETIIGFSGEVIPKGVMSESALEYENNKITGYNGSAFSAGNEYEAGNYVSIDNNTISVTGLQPSGNYQSAGDYVSASELENLQPKGDYYSASNPSGFLVNEDITGKLDTTAFSTVSGDFLTAVPQEYVTENTLQSGLSSKLDSTAFSTVSGDFLTAHQSLDDYATEQWVEDKGYITGVDIPQSADWNGATTVVNNNSAIWNNTTNVVSSNSASWGASNPQIPVTGINGIKISESGDKVVFEVSGDYTTHDDIADMATTGDINDLVTSIAETYQPKLSFEYNEGSAISAINGSALAGGGSIIGDYVSGVNLVKVPYWEGATGGHYYSANISGDVAVVTGDYQDGDIYYPGRTVSLSSMYNALESKLDQSTVQNSHTLKYNYSTVESNGLSYKATGFNVMSANNVDLDINEYDGFRTLWVNYNSPVSSPGGLYSAIVTVACSTFGTTDNLEEQGWHLLNSGDGSAVFYKYMYGAQSDTFYTDERHGWYITACEASAMTYSGTELALIAFKDDITGITYTTGSI